MQTCSGVFEVSFLSYTKSAVMFRIKCFSIMPVFEPIIQFKKRADKPHYRSLNVFLSNPLQPLVLLMEWPDASNFACLISGYYKLFVDPKRNIYFRAPGQSQLTKAGNILHL